MAGPEDFSVEFDPQAGFISLQNFHQLADLDNDGEHDHA